MGLLDLIKTAPIRMTQENQRMLFSEFCENTEEFLLPAKALEGPFSCNVSDTENKIIIDFLIEDKTYSFDVDKSEDGYKFLKNFNAALSYLDEFKEAFFVSHTANPVAEINIILDNGGIITFSLLLKKSLVLKQELVNIKLEREVFEREFVEKLKAVK